FTKSDSRQSGFSTGIGLAFTRQLTEAMGGNIHVESKEGWLHFFLEVPCQSAGGPAPENEEAIDQPSDLLQSMLESPATGLQPGSDAANKSSWLQSIDEPAAQTVLVVEDDPGMRFLLRDILKHTYTIFEADNGKDGLGWLAHHSCDCIISDIMMPVMSGLEFCEQVKQTAATCHIPVILLTARTNFDQQTEGYEAGADAYIAKPFNGQHLMVRIKTLLEGRRRMKEAFSNNAFALPQDETYQDEEKHWLSLLVKFVEDQLDNIELGAVDLEKFTAMSKMQLYRKLKTLTSMSPGEFIRNLRLQKAAQLLKQTNLTVSEIFYQTGFNNQSYFFREFRKQFGQSPGEYREQYRVKA
ncbi:MAG TPA: response regulator, partial [Chitinophagaceae bacterium]|nr:response regulator [Chitinophagaceae bacterium]